MFNPGKEPEKLKSWQDSEKRRVWKMQVQRFYILVQNYFWPTRLRVLPFIFVTLLSLERAFFLDQRSPGEPLLGFISHGCIRSLVLTLLFVHLRHLVLYLLFQYKSWIIEVKPSSLTKLWFVSVGLVSSKITNWLCGNWLLPSLPAPQPLESSVDRFVESMEPCLSDSKAAELRKMAEKFKKTVGPSLHSKVGYCT